MKRKSKCWEGVREKMEPRQSLQVKQEEVKSSSVSRGKDCLHSPLSVLRSEINVHEDTHYVVMYEL